MSKLNDLVASIRDAQTEVEQLLAREAACAAREERCATEEARLATLSERERVVTNRENAIQSIRNDLSLARAQKKAAEEREARMANELRQCRESRANMCDKLAKIKAAFPGMMDL